MVLTLVRDHCFADRTEGALSINGVPECVTLEPARRAENPVLAHPAIPAGEYKVTISFSPKFQRMLPHLGGVPGRQNIEIHAGNHATDTQGCILVGQSRLGSGIIHSRDALADLLVKLAQVLSKREPVTILIQDPISGEMVA